MAAMRRSITGSIMARPVRKRDALFAAAIARLTATLDVARSRAGKGKRRPPPMLSGRPLTPREMALEHYGDQLRFDDELRDTEPLSNPSRR
jgi:hypothetical protein